MSALSIQSDLETWLIDVAATTPPWQLKVDQLPRDLVRTEQGRKRVLDVEDWAEIRRLRRSEGMSISQIARVVGLAREDGQAGVDEREPAKPSAGHTLE